MDSYSLVTSNRWKRKKCSKHLLIRYQREEKLEHLSF